MTSWYYLAVEWFFLSLLKLCAIDTNLKKREFDSGYVWGSFFSFTNPHFRFHTQRGIWLMSHFWGGWKYLERRFSSRSASRTSKLTQIKPDKHFSLRCFSTEENEWKCIRINSVIASLMNGIILKSNYSTFVKDPLEQPQVPTEVPLWFLFSVCLILGQQLVATRNKDLQRASDASAHAPVALSYPLCLSSFIPARCVCSGFTVA